MFFFFAFLCGYGLSLNVGFYNTGQTSNIGEAINDMSGENQPEQSKKQITEIQSQSSDIDVLCLSNLLSPIQLKAYTDSLISDYQYSFSQLDIKASSDFDMPRTPCSYSDAAAISSECTRDALPKCDSIFITEGNSILDFMLCLASECPTEFEPVLYSECLSCMMIMAEINNNGDPMMGLGLAAWGCSSSHDRLFNFTDGNLLLSKYPIVNSWSWSLPSFIYYQQRFNVIQIDYNDRNVLVGCTTLNPTTYKDNSGSYVAVSQEQITAGVTNHITLNEMQIEKVLEYIDEINDNHFEVVLLGDLSVGETWNINNFKLFEDDGYVSCSFGDCTFCVDQLNDNEYYNSLASISNNLYDSSISKDLDHILIYNSNTDASKCDNFKRFMTNKIEQDGVEVPYSSRWGVSADVVNVVDVVDNNDASLYDVHI